MKILVACEFSGRVRDAFRAKGHDAWSCDIIPTEVPGPHIQADVLTIIDSGDWDMLIAFPPCTHLAISGAKHFAEKRLDGRQQEAIDFFMKLAKCKIPKKAIEQPKGIMSTHWRAPDQILQPWQFGHVDKKGICLWLENLPKLQPTKIIPAWARVDSIHQMPGVKNRAAIKSRTFTGIAAAMAEQWNF